MPEASGQTCADKCAAHSVSTCVCAICRSRSCATTNHGRNIWGCDCVFASTHCLLHSCHMATTTVPMMSEGLACFTHECLSPHVKSPQRLCDAGLVHRAIAPVSIWVCEDQSCIANLSYALSVGDAVVAPCSVTAFSAPELSLKTGHSPAADVWSAGAVLVWSLTGKLPCTFTGETPAL